MIRTEDISVVIITRNRMQILGRSLECLRSQTSKPREIIVIDSSDAVAAACLPNVEYVHFPPGRQQMPRARNEGTQRATGTVVAFLDDDCLADPEWLERIAEAYRTFPDAAGVGGRISDPRWKFDCTKPIGNVSGSGQITSNFYGDCGRIVDVDILPGGNMSFRREWLMRVGGFDPGYVATNHREDPDLCLRIRKAGGRLLYQPGAHAVHLNARNLLRELKPWDEFYLRYSFARNEAYFLTRHFPQVVLLRWATDTIAQFIRACKAWSLVGLLCVPIQAVSYGVGVCAQLLSRAANGGVVDELSIP